MEITADLTIKATSQDYTRWQMVMEDGETALSLISATSFKIRFQDKADKTIKEFITTDNPQKIFIVDAANGEVELRPAADDFDSVAAYRFQFIVVDSAGEHYISERKNYTLKVINNYPPS